MEKEKILSELTERLGKTSLSERTLSDYMAENLPADGVEPDDAYWAKHVKVLRSIDGNFNHDVSRMVEDFKKNFKPEPAPTPDDKPISSSDDAITKLGTRVQELEARLAATDRKTKMEALIQSVTNRSKELKVTNTALWNDAVKMVELKDNMSEEDLLASTKKVYESKLSAYVGNSATPYGGVSKGTPSKADEEAAKSLREAFKRRKQAEGKLPATQG